MNESNSILKIKTKTLKEEDNQKTNDQYRVVISGEANRSIEDIVERVNDGFKGGTVNKSNIANYIFLNLKKFISDSDIKTLRSLHFDEKKILTSLLKDDEDLPDDLRKAIRAHFGLQDKDKKKLTRSSSDLSTAVDVDNPDAV